MKKIGLFVVVDYVQSPMKLVDNLNMALFNFFFFLFSRRIVRFKKKERKEKFEPKNPKTYNPRA